MLVPACLAVAGLIAPSLAAAQDVAITNARVIVGSGQVIESGTIIVRGGRIVSVTAGAAPTEGLRTIDAKGMSAMLGFIDGHKHVNNGENAAAQMRSLLVVLEHGLKSFSIVFSMADIHKLIGPNAARYVGMADQIGTLEAGKLADIILIDGNRTLNIYEMLKTKVVLKEGTVVIDKR